MSDHVKGLHPRHADMLVAAGINTEVMAARGYRTLMRTNTDDGPRNTLKRLGFARGAWEEDRRFPGLLIPLHGPRGTVAGWQYRPDWPRKDDKGKVRKYEMPKGRAAVLDVHPRNRDRIVDPTVELWITEGIKKADALTSRGLCVVSISGVFNWRGTHGTLGEWEDIPLRGRVVVVAFDADAATNRNIARAMARLGNWLRSKQATVRFLVCPQVNGDGKTGVDDFLAGGGTVEQLREQITTRPPDPDAGDDSLTDSRLAERVADDQLRGHWRYCGPLGGWLRWTGAIWSDRADELEVIEQVRQYLRDMLADAVRDKADAVRLQQLATLQSRSRITAITALCRGMDGIHTDPLDFDEDPWLLCVGNGVVDLRTGELHPHDPDLLMRRQTAADYLPDAVHPDWLAALNAFPDLATQQWAQVVLGTGAAGVPATTDEVYFWVGSGANGKTTVIGACRMALGSYARVVAASLIGGTTPGHPTVKMELLGLRLAVVEELQEGHLLDEARVKEITGAVEITAYKMRQDPVTFRPSHTLVVNTNHTPKVRGTDTGIWRRLLSVPFPKTFRGATADPGLRERLLKRDQQRAVLAWLVAGAVAYYQDGQVLPDPPRAVRDATDEWRGSADPLMSWLMDHYVFDATASVETGVLLADFNHHQEYVERAKPWSAKTFTERLKANDWLAQRGVEVKRGPKPEKRSTVYGIRLATGSEMPGDRVGQGSPLTQESGLRENKQTTPSHPVPEHETPPPRFLGGESPEVLVTNTSGETPPPRRCSRCRSTFGLHPDKTLCGNCLRDDWREQHHIHDEQEIA